MPPPPPSAFKGGNFGVGDPNDTAGATTPGADSAAPTATATYQCWVRLTVGGDGKIKSTAWGGTADGCASYARRLR